MTEEEINKLYELKKKLDAEIISKEEFEIEKTKIIGNQHKTSNDNSSTTTDKNSNIWKKVSIVAVAIITITLVVFFIIHSNYSNKEFDCTVEDDNMEMTDTENPQEQYTSTTDIHNNIDAENLQLAVTAFEFIDEEFEKKERDNNVFVEYPCTIEGIVDFRNNLSFTYLIRNIVSDIDNYQYMLQCPVLKTTRYMPICGTNYDIDGYGYKISFSFFNESDYNIRVEERGLEYEWISPNFSSFL